MKMHHWMPILVWSGLLFGGLAQGWAQGRCLAKPSACCVPQVQVSQAASCCGKRNGDGADTYRQGVSCWGQASGRWTGAVKCDRQPSACCQSACGERCLPQHVATLPAKGGATAEPKRLLVPYGHAQRLTTCDSGKSALANGFGKRVACQADCSRENVFGTETILGDVSLGSLLAALPGKDLACGLGFGGGTESKMAVKRTSMPKCGCDASSSPILQGQPEEPAWEENPFQDDAVESLPLRRLPRLPDPRAVFFN
jgi:hypothetical protein